MSFETFVAGRFLKIRSQRKLVPVITILSTLGVTVGVMVLIVVIAVMTGFQSELKRRILDIDSHITVMRFNDWIRNPSQILSQVKNVDGVASAAPFVYAHGMLRSADGVSGVVIRGIDPERTGIQVKVNGTALIGDVLAAAAGEQMEQGVILGKVLADKLKVAVGSGVLLMVADARHASLRTLPQTQRLNVVGLFDTGMHQYDGAMGFARIDSLQRMIGVSESVTGIEVRVEQPDEVEKITQEIHTALGDAYWTTHWKRMNRNLFSMLAMQKVMMYVILTLIILVAAFNIASALIMMVKEKVKDIAILKVMGASNRSIRTIFLNKGMVIGLVGICAGACLGLVLCWIIAQYPIIELPGDVYFLTTLPIKITITDLALIGLGTFAICICASLYPASKAARLKPVDGVRYR